MRRQRVFRGDFDEADPIAGTPDAARLRHACSYWLDQELDMPDVQVVVALGATALKAVLDDPHARLQDAFDKTLERGEQRVLATYHPSFALRAPDPGTRRDVYE